MKRKWLAIGIMLLFVGASVPVAGNFIHKKTVFTADTPTIERTPSNGLYWNDRKIAEYPVLLFLHYYFKIRATFSITITIDTGDSGFNTIEFYLNGLLQTTIVGPGPTYAWVYNVTVTPFHHSLTLGIKAYIFDGEIFSDNVTIYRLFP
jgi:hypothetical protein